ncbi:hypothetical protein [Thiobacillus sp.]
MAGHVSLRVDRPKGLRSILRGDAADLAENLEWEIAESWPNHDLAFWRTLRRFPEFHE